MVVCYRALHGNGDGESRGFAGETCGNTAGMEWPVTGLPRGWN